MDQECHACVVHVLSSSRHAQVRNISKTFVEKRVCVMWCRRNQIEGQINLKDAVRRSITYKDPKSGKTYQLKQQACPPGACKCMAKAKILVCFCAVRGRRCLFNSA